MKRTLTVLSPVYNEEQVIEVFCLELRNVLQSLSDRYDSTILFVVDRCTDRTLEILRHLAQKDSQVRILALSSRFGHQMSLMAGMDQCDSDAVIMMDSDLQHPPALIPAMLREFEKGFDIVFTIREDPPETGYFNKSASSFFYRMLNRISEVQIPEAAADFRLISNRVLKVFQNDIRETNQFLRGLFQWVGFNVSSIHFKADPRSAGKTKFNLRRRIQFGIHGILSFSKKPLQAAIALGFLFAGFGLLYAVVTFIQFFYLKSFPSGWTTLTILISMFSGVQLIFLGIVGQYIGAIFDEVKRRPPYIIEERINFKDR